MGAAQSAEASTGEPVREPKHDDDGSGALSEVYKTTASEIGGGVAGGYTGGIVGGAGDLSNYTSTVYSLGKEDLIRKLASELGPALGDKGLSKKSIPDIIKKLKTAVPKKQQVKNNNESQTKICRALGQAVNNMYGRNIVNMSGDNASICSDAAEVMNTLFAGLQSEFVAVAEDVARAIKGIDTMDKVLTKARASLLERIDKSDDEVLRREAGAVRDLMDRTDQERERQMALLRNSMSIALEPARASLMDTMREQKSLTGYLKDIGSASGQKLSEKLTHMLVGTELLATVANTINQALKDVGMSVDEYKKVESNSALDDKIYELMNKKLKHASARDLTKFVNASEILRKNNYRHGDIAKMLSRPVAKSGGRPKKLDKQIAKSRKNRDVLRRDFSTRLGKLYARLLTATTSMVGEVGKGIPLSDKLAAYGRALDRLDEDVNVASENFARALLGEYIDSNAREARKQFINNMKNVADAADALKSGPHGDKFSEISKTFGAIITLIDNFSDVMKSAKKVTDNVLDAPEAGIDLSVDGGDEDKCALDVARSTANLRKAMQSFRYFYRSANLTVSMQAAAKARDKSVKDYEELVGEAIGVKITDIESKHADEIRAITELDDAIADKKAKDTVKKYLTARKNAVVGLYKTLEAVDAYLGVFTDGVAKNPTDIGKLIKILDGLNIAVKWYTEKSGDRLVELYELMPNDRGLQSGLDSIPAGKHYYDELKGSSRPGLPTTRVSPLAEVKGEPHVLLLLKRAKTAICAVGALKNLVSLFVSVGSEFGDKNALKKISLTPSQINKNLSNYVQMSAFGHRSAAETPTSSGAFVDKYSVSMRVVDGGDDAVLDSLKEEDVLLINTLKAMTAKALTAVGAYAMLTQADDANRGRPTDPVRVVLGGKSADVVIKPEATELYIRLVLLTEFYRKVFDLETAAGNGDESQVVALIPEFDNVWGKLINLVFDRTKYLENGNYSDAQVREIINECNEIMRLYRARNSKASVRDIIMEFVSEVNSRYGVYKRAELKAWIEERKFKPYVHSRSELDDATNFEILPGEGEPEYPRPAASDKYIQLPRSEGNPEAQRLNVLAMQSMVDEFAGRMSDAIELKNDKLTDLNNGFTFSLDENVRQIQARLHDATEKERFNIISEAIRTANQVSSMAGDRIVLLNETVIVPMTVASAVLESAQRYVAAAAALNREGLTSDETLRNLIEIVWSLQGDCNGLVDARIENENVLVDYSEVIDLVDTLLTGARRALDNFHLSLPRDVVERYERGINGQGGLEQLENRADVILRGIDSESNNVNRAANDLNDVLKRLIESGDDFKNVMRELVAWRSGGLDIDTMSGSITGLLTTDIGENNDVIKSYSMGLKNTIWGSDQTGSLVQDLNRLIAKHLNIVYDDATLKVFAGAISPLVDGAAHRAVMDSNTDDAGEVSIPDNTASPELKREAVVSQSLGYVLKRMTMERVRRGNDLVHVDKDASEIPNYIKELYRGNLPILELTAKLLNKRAKLLKSVLSSKLSFDADEVNLLEGVIDNVGAVNRDLLKSIDGALRAADYAPKWGETGKDSSAHYRSQNGKDPLVPASVALGALTNSVDTQLRAGVAPGTIAFKYNYLVQAMLVKDLTLDDMAGAKRLLDGYNASATSDVSIDAKVAGTTVAAQMRALRYELVARRHASQLAGAGGLARDLQTEVPGVTRADGTADLPATTLSNQLGAYGYVCRQGAANAPCSATELVDLVENSNRKRSLARIAAVVGVGGLVADAENRDEARVFNILDMNINPIDVNALRRDVPLVNIYNYARTWNKIVEQILDPSGNPVAQSPRDLLASLLQAPQRKLEDQNDDRKLLGDLMVGLSDTELGRPRYLSDQVHGKLLIRDLNPSGDAGKVSPAASTYAVNRIIPGAPRPRALTRRGDDGKIKVVELDQEIRDNSQVQNASRLRMDSVLVRNLLLIVNSHRLLRMRMEKEVERITGPVVKDIKTLNRRVTEFNDNEMVDKDPPYSRG